MSGSAQFTKWLSNPSPGEEVVITGISGRFPESRNIQEFQDNLFNQKDLITDDDENWRSENSEKVQRSGKISEIDKLDSGYFGLHFRQAEMLNPIIRKFLETAVEAIIDSGVNPSELAGSKTMVCVGVSYLDNEINNLIKITEPQKFGVTGYLKTFIATRLSYYLKLKGPSYVVDSACSSSMSALEEAFKSIRTGKCDNALVGGCHLIFHPDVTTGFLRSGPLSVKGVCKVFDEDADGYVRSEAVACVFLQKAKNSRRIYAQVICVKANCDGFKNLGITYPSSQMQKKLIAETLEESGIDPSEIDFFEAHGTGTKVGDSEEIDAIDNAIAKKIHKPLLIGSLKSSVGHTEPMSGLCSLFKAIFAMETGYIPPNIHLKTVKKELVGITEGRMKVVTEKTAIVRNEAIIGINNFGIGGVNTVTLLKRFKKIKVNEGMPQDDIPRLVCVSGRTEKAVSLLLEDINKIPIDVEYVSLLQHIFKKGISGHFYRGYTIVSRNGIVKTEMKTFSAKRDTLKIVLGQFEQGYQFIVQDLRKFSSFNAIYEKISRFCSSDETNGSVDGRQQHIIRSFAVQTGFVKLLEILQLDLDIIYVDSVGKLIHDYCFASITLEQALEAFEKISLGLEKNEHYCESNFLNKFEATSKNSVILNIADKVFEHNIYSLTPSDSLTFLEILGRLYQEGYDFCLEKLYPIVPFPVSRRTPMISSLIDWNHSKSWYTCRYDKVLKASFVQQIHNISAEFYENNSYLTGHVVAGRNFIPVSEYLHLVWKTFTGGCGISDSSEHSIVFENCNFVRVIELLKDQVVNLLVTIQRSSGMFKILEKDSTIVSGRVFLFKDMKQHQLNLPFCNINQRRIEFLNQNEIYQKFSLRDHKYSGLFKSMKKCNFDGTAALIKWENNWTAFMENMLQLKLLDLETKSSCIITNIQNLSISARKHQDFIKEHYLLCPAYYQKQCNILRSGGIEISGIKTRKLIKTNSFPTPLLRTYTFIPICMHTNLEESIRIIAQIIAENNSENNFKAVEFIDKFTRPNSEIWMPLFYETLKEIPVAIPDLSVSSKTALNVAPEIEVKDYDVFLPNDFVLVIAKNVLRHPTLLTKYLNALTSDGFLLTQEEFDFVPENTEQIQVITEHVVNKDKLILFRKIKKKDVKCIEVLSNNFDWIPQLQTAMKKENNVVLFNQNVEPEGILGVINCLRREPKEIQVSCVLMMCDAPKFDPTNNFYSKQLKKNLIVNIFKDYRWGTYRYLLLNSLKEKEEYFDRNEKMTLNVEQASVEKISETRAAVTLVGDNPLQKFPDGWRLEDVSEVLVAYATAFYVLFKVIRLKPQMSILINSDDNHFGFAVLNTCLYCGCNIYLTAENETRQKFFKNNYPQILASHVKTPNDRYFENLIRREANGYDVVFDTSALENLEATIRCMAPGGTFLHIEQLNSNVCLNSLLEKNITYHSITLDRVFFESPNRRTWILEKICEGFKMGYIKPLTESTSQNRELLQAYKYIETKTQGEKILIEFRGNNDKIVALPEKMLANTPSKFYCHPKKSYIILGGLGGFGLELAEWLCLRGARKIVLTSRVGIRTGFQNQKIRKLESTGVTVQIFTGNITWRQGCQDLIDDSNKLGPLDGIFNLAVVVKDALFEDQNAETFDLVSGPKAKATLYLDQISRASCPELRHFVVFSAFSSGCGNAGQTNYAMANSIMEMICEKRKRDGFPGLAIQWGPIGDVGLAAGMEKENKTLVIGGCLSQRLESCLEVLDTLLLQNNPIVSSSIISPKNKNSMSRNIVDAVVSILGIKNIKTVDIHTSLVELGLDSITSTKMINVLKKDFGVTASARILRKMTFASLMELEADQKIKTHEQNNVK